MERSPKNNDETLVLTHINLKEDLDLLRALRLHEEVINDQWLRALDRQMEAGAQEINRHQTVSVRWQVIGARHARERMLELHKPERPLHGPYVVCARQKTTRTLPPV